MEKRNLKSWITGQFALIWTPGSDAFIFCTQESAKRAAVANDLLARLPSLRAMPVRLR
jgi:hypothetical protein